MSVERTESGSSVPQRASRDIRTVRPIIGMEVHVELSTRSKMFSRAPSPACALNETSGANELCDATVLGLPGSLPVMNREALRMSVMVGLALNCSIAERTKWDRKSYFYPDLPKGYQISQYDMPLAFDGAVDVPAIDERGTIDPDGESVRIRIIRAHLEEDAGKLMHEAPGGGDIDFSIADYNRAGTPLLEIVTAPDFTASDRCVSFARLLRQIVRFLSVSEAVMQKGHMRFEPNINCEIAFDDGSTVRTPIVEVKNLNSFRALRDAIDYEIREQPGRWREDGRETGPGTKITRGWDEARGVTTVQREKEDANDYRYFPDPDLPVVVIDAAWLESIRAELPMLPLARLKQYVAAYALTVKEAAVLVSEREVAACFEATTDFAASAGVDRARAGRLAANLLLQSGLKRANERALPLEDLGIDAPRLAMIVGMRDRGDLSAQAADEIVGVIIDDQTADPASIARDRGLLTVRDRALLDSWVAAAIDQNAQAAADVRAGKMAAIGRLVGAAMKTSNGAGDAKEIREAIIASLQGDQG